MEKELKSIIEKYGETILLSNKKLVSIFADTALRLKKEKKLLEMALNENIGNLFANCEKSERSTSIIKAIRKLENNYMAENAINDVVAVIIYALGWTEEYNRIKNEKKVEKQADTKPEETKNVKTEKENNIHLKMILKLVEKENDIYNEIVIREKLDIKDNSSELAIFLKLYRERLEEKIEELETISYLLNIPNEKMKNSNKFF